MGDVDLPDAQLVLRRAVQLDRAVSLPPSLSPDALEAAAAELGVAPAAVAMALAELRAGAAEDHRSFWERVIGPKRVVVVRSCQVAAPTANRLTIDWLERGHLLRVTTPADGVVVGRRRNDAMAKTGRMVRSLHGEGGLSKVREIRGGVGALADGTTAVCVQADVSDSRNGAVAVGSSVGTLAMAGVGLCTLVFTPFAAVAAPFAVVGGVVAARHAHKDTVQRVQRSLEETTDAVAGGTPPPSAIAGLGRGLRRRARADRR